jgi:outer membrane protein
MTKASLAFCGIALSALAAGLVVSPAPARADAGKIGYISSTRVFREYAGSADVQKQFQKDLDEWRKQAQAMKDEIEKLTKEIDNQALMLSDEAKEKKRQEIDQKNRDYEQFVTEIWGTDGKAARRELELTKPLVSKIDKILEDLGNKEGFDLIIDIEESSIVFSKEGLDLTDRVLEELNKEIVPIVGPGEKAKLAVFIFKEMNVEAMEGGFGTTVSTLMERALVQLGLFEKWEGGLPDALTQEGVVKEQDIDPAKAVDVCRIAGDDVAVIGNVSKLGATVEIEAKIIDVKTGNVLGTEQGKTTRSESEEELLPMIGDVSSRLVRDYKPK